MKDFFNWLRRYSKSRFFKFILFFIVFCIVSLCKSCKVNAWTRISYLNSNSIITYNFTNLVYKQPYYYSAGDTSYSVVMNSSNNSIPVNNDMILKNIVFKYHFNNITIDNTKRYISINLANFLGGDTNSNNSNHTNKNFLSIFKETSSIPVRPEQLEYVKTNFLSFRPFYAEYFDVTANEYKPCNVEFISMSPLSDSFNNSSPIGRNSNYTFEIPVGVTTNDIRIYFGIIDNFTGLLNFADTTYDNLDYFNYDDNFYNYYQFFTNNQFFIKYLNGSYLAFVSRFVPNLNNLKTLPSWDTSGYETTDLAYNNTKIRDTYVRFRKTYDFSNKSLEQLQEIADLQEKLDYEYTLIDYQVGADNQEENMTQNSDNLSGTINEFRDNEYSSNFTGLFSSLFLYPLQKLETAKDIDLRGTNEGGNNYMNLGLCTGTDLAGNFGSRYKIFITDTDFYELPCPHYDIYPHIHTQRYYFMGGVNGFAPGTFEYLWRTVMRGLLVYFLFVTILQTYKYVLDIKDTSVEVLEL